MKRKLGKVCYLLQIRIRKTASKKHIKNRKYNKARLDGLNLSDCRLQQLELSVEIGGKKYVYIDLSHRYKVLNV